MKKVGALFLMIFFGIIGLPALITSLSGGGQSNNLVSKSEDHNIKTIKVLDEKTKDVTEIEFEEYIKGVLAAEMPALFEKEALKAQAVAARTYAIKKLEQKNNKVNKEEYISTDPSKGQAYLSIEELKTKWGENFYTYYNKIAEAVEETSGQIMIYDEEPIEAVFHSTSAGITQSAKDVWQIDVPYLQSVESVGDEEAPVFDDEKRFSAQESLELLMEKYPDIVIQDLKEQIQIVERSSAGYVKKIQIGNKLLTGEEIRNVFSLRSSCFSIKVEGDDLIFSTKGYGHGAGMSQYGANYMAKEGKDYKDILTHYYQGVKIVEMDELKENISKDE